MADEKDAVEQKKSGGGKGLIIALIVLVVLLLGAVGAGGYLLYTKGVFSDAPPEAAATTAKTEAPMEAEDEDIGETFQSKIDNLVLNITDAKGRAKLMKLSFTIKSTEPTIGSLVDANKAELVDSVIKQISARSSEELLTVGGKAMLKEEMIDEINNILNDAIGEQEEIKKNSVVKIFFTSFVIK
jgi:flagellar FliL protein